MSSAKTYADKLHPDGCDASTEEEYCKFWEDTAQGYDAFVAQFAPECHKLVPYLLLSYEQERNFKVFPRDGNVLDIGCGTGNTAQAMTEIFGFEGNMDGIEGSSNMATIARDKNIYRDIFVEFLDSTVSSPLRENFYDFCIAGGSFGERAIKAARIKDIFPFIKPGGYLALASAAYTLREPYKGASLSTVEMIAEWEKEGLMTLVHKCEFPDYWVDLAATGILLQKPLA